MTTSLTFGILFLCISYEELIDDYGENVCDANMDEDDYARMLERGGKECPYWRDGDDYKVVRHQM